MPLSEIPNPDGLTDPDDICAAYIERLTYKPDNPKPNHIEMLNIIDELTDQLAATLILLGVE